MRVVGQNLCLGFLFSTAGITLGVTGLVNPLFAAGAMWFSIRVVVGNSVRLNPSLASIE
jgi:cation transport ATPase